MALDDIELPPDYDGPERRRRNVDHIHIGTLRSTAGRLRWDEAETPFSRLNYERRWGFYGYDPLPTKSRNRYRSPVRTLTG